MICRQQKSKSFILAVFDGFETACANFITRYKENKYLKKYITKEPIPADFKKEYETFWKSFKIVRGGKVRLVLCLSEWHIRSTLYT